MSTKMKAVVLATLLALNLGIFSAPEVFAQIGGAVGPTPDITTCTQWQIDQGLCDTGLRGMVLRLLNWFLLFLGLIATGFLIFGGFTYITSAGNDQNVEKGKKVIIYAAIGILVILLSAVLVNALLGAGNVAATTAG